MIEETVPSIWSLISSYFTPTYLFLVLNLVIGIIVISSSFGSHKPKSLSPQLHNHLHQPQQQQHQQSPIDFLHHDHLHHHQQQPPLVRAPSVLERFKSINLYHFKAEDFNPFHSSTHFHHPPTEEPIINFSSSETNHHHQQQQQEYQPPLRPQPLARAPSILQRLKSINLYNFKPEDFNPFSSINNNFQQQSQPVQKQSLNSTQVQKRRQQSREKNPDEILNHRALDSNRSKSRDKINIDDDFLDSLVLSKKNSKSKEKISPDDELFRDLRALNKNKSKTRTEINNYNNPDDEFVENRVLNKNKLKKSSFNGNDPDDEFTENRVLNKNKLKSSFNGNNPDDEFMNNSVLSKNKLKSSMNNKTPDDEFVDHRALNKNKSKTIQPRQKVKQKILVSAKSDVIDRNKFEEEEEEMENHTGGGGGDDEHVDAKADDFINRFKNQLKLQRLDSIMGYKDILKGGGGGGGSSK